MSKIEFGPAEVMVILEHISGRSAKFGEGRIPSFAVGYLSSLLKSLAEVSPAARKELLSHVEFIKSECASGRMCLGAK